MGNKLNRPITSGQPPGVYRLFDQIDGRHPLRNAVADSYVDYRARVRQGGEVFFFNFNLARDMGLIPQEHPDRLTAELRRLLIRRFGLQIINEYDLAHGVNPEASDVLPHPYMATRYLQLQHPDKKGATSGDGRSIWNGCVNTRKGTWDISSCGTGVTCLSPATANEGRYFKTGDKQASYGSGRSDMLDGVAAALMSEILHGNDIPTERTLAVISYRDGSSVNVRAYRNLLRPAHFFRYMKQGNLPELKRLVDYYIERQIKNGDWPEHTTGRSRYQYFLERITEDFAVMAARFEAEYIFCWMDWDGDNILTDGGIIDYGSLRQFGLFHHEYRYEDVDRYSTTIAEQRGKARYIVQTFVQIIDFIESGHRKNLSSLRNHAVLRRFDRIIEDSKDRFVLAKIGFNETMIRRLLNDRQGQGLVRAFRRDFHHFERVTSYRSPHKVEDGITRDVVFCLRDMLRELPGYLLKHGMPMPAQRFVDVMASAYASRRDLRLYPARKIRIRRFQQHYQLLVMRGAEIAGRTVGDMLAEIRQRSVLINRYDRITGDAVLHVSTNLIRQRKKMKDDGWYQIFRDFIDQQILNPDYFASRAGAVPSLLDHLRKLQRIVGSYRAGL
ncbi:MAG: YdiU family protein [Gammaproteobacteria bacterium]|nr:YdiU family protein [Gammaproteobacteria bacterium]